MNHPLLGLLTIFTLWTLGTIGVCGMAAVGWGMWPRRAARVQAAVAERAAQAMLLGLVNALAYLIVVVLLHRAGVGRFAFLVLALWTVCLTSSGLPGVASSLGERILAQGGGSVSRLRDTWVGIAAIGAASVIPLVGWTLLAAFLLTCFGGGLTVFLRTLRGEE